MNINIGDIFFKKKQKHKHRRYLLLKRDININIGDMNVISSFITHPALISYRLWPRPTWNATIRADNKYLDKKKREKAVCVNSWLQRYGNDGPFTLSRHDQN